jgi:hypothetical protein
MQEPDALAVRLIIGDFLLDECCRGKWTPRHLEALDEAISHPGG